MPYSIKYGTATLYEHGSDVYAAHDASIKAFTNSASTLQLTIPPTNPTAESLAVLDYDNPVRVAFDGKELFRGFVTRVAKQMSTELVVTCESELALLSRVHATVPDNVSWDGYRMGRRANWLFSNLIGQYNAAVGSDLQFTIGHNLGNDEIGYYDSYLEETVVSVSASNPTPILDIIDTSILTPYGCMLRVWHSGGTRYIGLYSTPPTDSGQVIRLGENMTDLVVDVNTEDLYTACYPVGGTRRTYDTSQGEPVELTRSWSGMWDEDTRWPASVPTTLYMKSYIGGELAIDVGDVLVIGDGEYRFATDNPVEATETVVVTQEGIGERLSFGTVGYVMRRSADSKSSNLTLGRIADGTYSTGYNKVGNLVINTAAAERYGLRTFTLSDTDIRYTRDLLSRGTAELKEKVTPTYTLEVDGVDMALYASGHTHLVPGETVRVVSDPHGVDATMRVAEMAINLDDPGATRHTLGPLPRTATGMIRASDLRTEDVRGMLTRSMNDVVPTSKIWRLQ